MSTDWNKGMTVIAILLTHPSSLILHPSDFQASPLHASFLGRVDLREVGGLVKEEALDVVEKKILRVRVSKIQPVMVDDLCLFL